jgi:hypothetical protein
MPRSVKALLFHPPLCYGGKLGADKWVPTDTQHQMNELDAGDGARKGHAVSLPAMGDACVSLGETHMSRGGSCTSGAQSFVNEEANCSAERLSSSGHPRFDGSDQIAGSCSNQDTPHASAAVDTCSEGNRIAVESATAFRFMSNGRGRAMEHATRPERFTQDCQEPTATLCEDATCEPKTSQTPQTSRMARAPTAPYERLDTDDAHDVNRPSDHEQGSSLNDGAESSVGSCSPALRRSPRQARTAATLYGRCPAENRDRDTETRRAATEGVRETVRDEDYCPSPAHTRDSSPEDGCDDHRKRRRTTRSFRSSIGHAGSAQKAIQGRRLAGSARSPLGDHSTSTRRVPSPTSHVGPVSLDAVMAARFEEWVLKNVSMKRITEKDKTTFQFQFEWPACSHDNGHEEHTDRSSGRSKRSKLPQAPPVALSPRCKWTVEEETKVCEMKRDGRSWAEIQRALPHRSKGSIQVQYSTKLKRQLHSIEKL